MDVVLVNPLAGLVALLAVLPLVALARVHRRGRAVRRSLGLGDPPRRSSLALAGAVVMLSALVGTAAAQPVAVDTRPQLVRTDAEVFFVLDITRSMLAAPRPDAPPRIERAQRLAIAFRRSLADVPAGVASMTNRLVPHLFPTPNGAVFTATIERAIGVERPPPDVGRGAVLTAFGSLAVLRSHNFFGRDARRRVAVVLTDGESLPVPEETVRRLAAPPRVELVLVRVRRPGERIFAPERPFDAGYRSDDARAAELDRLAAALRAPLHGEDDVEAAARDVRRLVGSGRRVPVGEEARARPLAPWVLAAAALPLGFMLRRRNL